MDSLENMDSLEENFEHVLITQMSKEHSLTNI
jgi:hypothetical protein